METHEPLLRAAFVARFGADVGRAVTVDALSYGWEHWKRLQSMENPIGYLYRVGQSSSRRYASRPIPTDSLPNGDRTIAPDRMERTLRSLDPELEAALDALPEKQRLAVILVHAHGHTHRAAADLLGVSTSTIQTQVERGLAALRRQFEADRPEPNPPENHRPDSNMEQADATPA